MHVGYSPCVAYSLNDEAGNRVTIKQITEEKDLGVHITADLKSSTQCISA